MPPEATSRAETRSIVIAALTNVLGRPLEDPSDETRLFEELSLDSTSVLGLLMELEDAVRLEVDPDELEREHLATIGSITDFIQAQLAAQTSEA